MENRGDFWKFIAVVGLALGSFLFAMHIL